MYQRVRRSNKGLSHLQHQNGAASEDEKVVERDRGRFSSNLSVLHEAVEADFNTEEAEEAVTPLLRRKQKQKPRQKVTVTVEDVDEVFSAAEEKQTGDKKRKSSVLKRWSRLKTFGKTTARLSKGKSVSEGEECDEVDGAIGAAVPNKKEGSENKNNLEDLEPTEVHMRRTG